MNMQNRTTGRIVVNFDPAILRASMELWRKSTDMEIALADEFKIHFMEEMQARFRERLEANPESHTFTLTRNELAALILHDTKAR